MTIAEAQQKYIAWNLAQVGTREGANNWNKYAEDPRLQQLLGWNAQCQPWCDLYTDEGFIECFGLEKAAAMTYQPIGKGSALCSASAQFFKDNGAWSRTPQLGAVIFFFYSGGINHQGVVVAIQGSVVVTVEGNSSDKVSKNSYNIGDARIAGYGIPKWSVVATESADETGPSAPSDETGAADSPTPTAKDYRIPDAQYHAYAYKVDLNLLKIGDKGPLVQSLQLLLNGKGFPCGKDDGEFGTDTRDALLAFQNAAGILADGECGGQSWAALHNYHV